jgi:hypothetical protein
MHGKVVNANGLSILTARVLDATVRAVRMAKVGCILMLFGLYSWWYFY